jgi:hypothetical protein
MLGAGGARLQEYGQCIPPPPRAGVALASGVHLFAAVRRTLRDPTAFETSFGIEFSPNWLLPPYGWGRWHGYR